MRKLLDLPTEILDDILKDVISEEMEGYLSNFDRCYPGYMIQLATTCRQFYELIRRHFHSCCTIEYGFDSSLVRLSPKNTDTLLNIYKNDGHLVRKLVVTTTAGCELLPEKSKKAHCQLDDISATIQIFLPYFSNLKSATFSDSDDIPLILLFGGIRAVVTGCLGLKNLVVDVENGLDLGYEIEALAYHPDKIVELDPSRPHACLEMLGISYWPGGRARTDMTRKFLAGLAKILKACTETVTKFVFDDWLADNYDASHRGHAEYPYYEPRNLRNSHGRFWSLPAVTILHIRENPATNRALNDWWPIDPLKVMELGLHATLGTFSKRIAAVTLSYPNIKCLDLTHFNPTAKPTIDYSYLLPFLSERFTNIEHVHTTVPMAQEETKKILGERVMQTYEITYGPPTPHFNTSPKALSREDETSAETPVTLADQTAINTFSILHSRHTLLTGTLADKTTEKEYLTDVSSELELSDDDDIVPYKIGDAFVSLRVEEVREMLENEIKDIDGEIEELEGRIEKDKEEMDELKVHLYAKFGRSINLEA
ncbi:hypothetical protein H072_4793 [Dactylellina haptotyla CBS 200.50]|uniref:F-box domain-containing protein n=1 Tax=Dactylellina haptotyla (strain CBS 200.50) TaxID=1284197 RepID=S8AEC5_DACHA|nr:hypothetical protein H072_4793 [Dactylellina haptotyla CBS 200.50]